MPQLRYPLNDSEKYPATIQFKVYKTDPPTFNFVKRTAKNNANASTDNATNLNGVGVDTQGNFISLDPGELLATSKKARQAKKMAEDIARIENTNTARIKESKARFTGNSCTLYMPQGLVINDGVQYDTTELGVFGSGIEAGMNAGSAPVAALVAGGIKSGIGDLGRLISGAASQQSARIAAARFTPGAALGGAVRSSLQTAPNPNMRVLFKSVGIREFSFTFKLIPKSLEESNEITRIVRFFRTELYPEPLKEKNINLAYKFPNKFQVVLMYNGKPYKESALNFNLMFLKGVAANYNPSQSTFFTGGRFSEIDMTLTMQEDRTLDKFDVDDGLSDEKGIVNATNIAKQYLKTGLGG